MNRFPALGPPVQIAYSVPDVEVAAELWARQFGAGPFLVRRHIPLVEVTHRGRPATFDHSSAYGQWGELMVELIESHGPEPDVVSEVAQTGAFVLHHLAHLVDDLDVAVTRLAEAGCEVLTSAVTAGGTRFVFVDTRPILGHLVELYERSERLTAFYASIAAAAVGWSGADPVREA